VGVHMKTSMRPFLRWRLFSLVLAASCGTPPQVVQGTVVAYDAGSGTLTVRSEAVPVQVLEFSLEGAEIGTEPKEGDVVRIAFLEEGGKRHATRVMNVTRQEELGGKGGH
jgi:hypothetical protein